MGIVGRTASFRVRNAPWTFAKVTHIGQGAVDSGLAVAGCADANSAKLLAPTEN